MYRALRLLLCIVFIQLCVHLQGVYAAFHIGSISIIILLFIFISQENLCGKNIIHTYKYLGNNTYIYYYLHTYVCMCCYLLLALGERGSSQSSTESHIIKYIYL